MCRSSIALSLVVAMAGISQVHAQHNAQRGAVAGGIGGAIVGALIGDHNDEAGAGAAIGGALGAVAGSVMGNAADKDAALYGYGAPPQYRGQAVGAPAAAAPAYPQGAVSTSDVVSMTRAGLADNVIINHINRNGVQRTVEVSDIIAMHQQGVREPVIAAMQNARVGSVQVAPAPQPAPVIVRPEYHVAPAYVVPVHPRWHHHHYHHRPRHGSSVSFSFGL